MDDNSQGSDLTKNGSDNNNSSSSSNSGEEAEDAILQILAHHICNNPVQDFYAAVHMSPLCSPLSSSLSLFIVDEQNPVIV